MKSLFIDLNDCLDPVNKTTVYGYSKGNEVRQTYRLKEIFERGNIRIVLKMPELGIGVSDSFLSGLLTPTIATGIFRVRFDELFTVVGDETQRQRINKWIDREFEKQSILHKSRAWISGRLNNLVRRLTKEK